MYFRLSHKLTLILLISATLSMVLLGGIYHQRSQHTIESLVLSHLRLVANQVKIQVDRYIATQRDRINLISSRTQLRISLDKILNKKDIDENKRRIQKILNDAQSSIPDITSLIVYNSDNALIAATSPVQPTKALDSKQTFTSSDFDQVFVSKKHNITRLKIGSRLTLDGRDLGILVMELDVSGLEQSLFTENNETRPEKAIIYFKNNQDIYKPILNHPNTSYNNVGFNRLIRDLNKISPNSLLHLSQLGKEYLGFNKSLNLDRWGILLTIDTDIALKPLKEQNQFLTYSILIILLILVILSLIVGNRITRPIVDMAYVARLIGEGDFSKRINKYSNDEIGVLGETLNLMAEKLISANRELDKKVKEKTLDLRLANEQLHKLNQEITEQSKIDPLTRIKNRRAFDNYLKGEIKRANRDTLPISLMIIDIDHFKLYNDALGHQKGDECLIKVAQSLDSCAKRDSDLVARYGGEEFVVVLPNTNESAATAIAKQIQLELEIRCILHPNSPTSNQVTLSIGITTDIADKNHILKADQLIELADQALYQAKDSGRNQAIQLNRKDTPSN